ncbi:hypothetical protein BBBGCB_BBBGCB_09860, partial [Dysosmobacter welbionis]
RGHWLQPRPDPRSRRGPARCGGFHRLAEHDHVPQAHHHCGWRRHRRGIRHLLLSPGRSGHHCGDAGPAAGAP